MIMYKKILFFCCLFSSCLLLSKEPSFLSTDSIPHLWVNNRILATVNGKPISVIDVMKKMDVLFYKQFPQYIHSPVARFQFFKMHWKNILQDLIDKELILEDAKENKVEVSHGDVRQELENNFGPNIINNLDKAGLTYDEAWKMMKEELILRRMMFYRVHGKAVRKVTPQDIKIAYEEFAQTNKLPARWTYRVVTIRSDDPENGAEAANFVFRSLVANEETFDTIAKTMESHASFGNTCKISVSELLTQDENDLASAYKEVLSQLNQKTYSAPTQQKSRKDNSSVFRIFFLEEHRASGAPPFQEVATKIQNALIEQVAEEEGIAYFAKLKKRYHIHDKDLQGLNANGFEPFSLR